jgi:AraC-like DNA-binding protein
MTATTSASLVRRAPHPALRPLAVRGYLGYAERTAGPLARIETPHPAIVVIVNLGPRLRVDGEAHGSFAAGLTDLPVLTEHPGEQAGIQLDLTPMGARMLLGVPLREIARRTVALDALLPQAALARLRGAEDWDTRFALLDALLLARLDAAAAPRPDVAYAWSRLVATRGAVSTAQLCAELGCSRRHLSARFGEEVGLGPKAFARVVRFHAATDLTSAGHALADVAAACGFADQPHLTREFRAMAGCTPGAFPNVQDAPPLPA